MRGCFGGQIYATLFELDPSAAQGSDALAIHRFTAPPGDLESRIALVSAEETLALILTLTLTLTLTSTPTPATTPTPTLTLTQTLTLILSLALTLTLTRCTHSACFGAAFSSPCGGRGYIGGPACRQRRRLVVRRGGGYISGAAVRGGYIGGGYIGSAACGGGYIGCGGAVPRRDCARGGASMRCARHGPRVPLQPRERAREIGPRYRGSAGARVE